MGLCALLPAAESKTAKYFLVSSRTVDVNVEGFTLLAVSDAESGELVRIEIYSSRGGLETSKECSGYSCAIGISGLPAGMHRAHVITEYGWYDEWFARQ